MAVVEPARSGAGVDVLGPWGSGAAAVGEVDEGLAKPVVATAAERGVARPPGCPGRRGDAGGGREGVVGGIAATGVDAHQPRRGRPAELARSDGEPPRPIGARGAAEAERAPPPTAPRPTSPEFLGGATMSVQRPPRWRQAMKPSGREYRAGFGDHARVPAGDHQSGNAIRRVSDVSWVTPSELDR